jgi:hypothetical protein
VLFDVGSLRFENVGVPCLYDFHAWSSHMSKLFDVQSDLDLYRGWRNSAIVGDQWEASWSPLISDAYVVIRDDLSALVSKPLDLGGVELWCRLWDALTAVSRIVAVPTMRPSDVDTWSYVDSVCTLAAICFYVADTHDVSVISASRKNLARVVSPLRLDVICGRGGSWSAMALDMVRVVGAASGIDGSLMSDAMARLRVNALAQRVAAEQSIETSEAASAMGAAILDVAGVFDEWQYRCYQSSRLPWFDIDEDMRRGLMHEQVLVSYADALVPRADAGICRGWCADFCVTPVSCVCALPRDLDESVSDSYFRKHVSEIAILMYGGEV